MAASSACAALAASAALAAMAASASSAATQLSFLPPPFAVHRSNCRAFASGNGIEGFLSFGRQSIDRLSIHRLWRRERERDDFRHNPIVVLARLVW